MNPKAAQVVFGVVLFLALNSNFLLAQNADATLSGTVTDLSGEIVSNAKLSVKNLTTGNTTEIQTDASGGYKATLPPGDYEISVTAKGFATKQANVTLTSATTQTINPVLSPAPTSRNGPLVEEVPTQTQNLPNAPSTSKTAPSLEDLGFSPAESQANAKQQALLDKRTHMLKIHQRMGLITTVPLLATLITSVNAGGKNTSTTSRDVHTALGAVTADLYFITAYYAIRAPRFPGTETRGPIRLHKALAWIHGPGMILTPILGAMAFSQKSNGEKVHGIAKAHGPVAIVTAGAFGAALLSVSVKF